MTTSLTLRLLSDEEISTIYEKCLDYLSEKGVEVSHVEGLKLLDKAGAKVDSDKKLVRFSRGTIERALQSVPHTLTLANRNKQ